MQVKDAMSKVVVTVRPGHTLRHAAASMDERRVGAAVVLDPEAPGPGIITERDVLRAVAATQDLDAEMVSDHLTSNVVVASPDWSLEEAAGAMVRGSFRHLLVIDGEEVEGVLSVRDIVRCWTEDGATSERPASPDTSG